MPTGNRVALMVASSVLLGYSIVSVDVSVAADTATSRAQVRDASTQPGSPRLAVDRVVYFTALDGTHGRELWRSDGTDAGTTMVKDIRPGRKGSNPGRLTAVDGTLFFEAVDDVHGRELWMSDGTRAGTLMVKDIRPGARGSTTHPYYPLEELGTGAGDVYFAANDGIHGFELWTSDGTASGTIMVKDTHRGYWGSNPEYFTDVDGHLFFLSGSRIWKSDGTRAGTVMVKNIPDDQVGYLTDYADALFFVSSEHLWMSDGTRAGTNAVKDILAAQWLTVVDGTLYPHRLRPVRRLRALEERWDNLRNGCGEEDQPDAIHVALMAHRCAWNVVLQRERRYPWLGALEERWDRCWNDPGERHPSRVRRSDVAHRCGRDAVLRRQRQHRRHCALEERWDRCRDDPREGHPRGIPSLSSLAHRRGRDAVLHR